jgi:hypothetical protein
MTEFYYPPAGIFTKAGHWNTGISQQDDRHQAKQRRRQKRRTVGDLVDGAVVVTACNRYSSSRLDFFKGVCY